jgi:hypothetical protein
MSTPTDYCAELQRLVKAYDEHGGKWPDHHVEALFQAVEDARAALAQPEPVAPTDEAWQEFIEQVQRAQHVAIREGECPPFDLVECAMALWREAIPPAPEPPTDEKLLSMRSWSSHGPTFDSDLVDFGRRCYDLAKQPVSTPYKLPEPMAPTDEELLEAASNALGYVHVRVDSKELEANGEELIAYARAVLAGWGRPVTPPAPETLAGALAARPLLEKVARMADCIDQRTVAEIMAISSQAAAWLEANPPGQPVAIEPHGCPTPGACSCVEPTTPAPQPVPVSERLPGPDDLDDQGTCWMFHPINLHYCLCRPDPSVHTHWLPHHSLPTPPRNAMR